MTRRSFTRTTKLDNQVTVETDAALERRPPRIRWVHNGKGIQVAVEVDDPHGEKWLVERSGA